MHAPNAAGKQEEARPEGTRFSLFTIQHYARNMQQILQRLPNRREAACLLALQQMADVWPNGRTFWTLTYPKPIAHWWVGNSFERLWRRWQRKLGRCVCVKVVELHKTHGPHIHLILNKRYPKTEVERMARNEGFGIIDARAVRPGDAMGYLAKYLTKDRRRIHGCNRYGVLGATFGRIRDVVIVSEASSRMKQLWREAKAENRRPTAKEIRRCFLYGPGGVRRVLTDADWSAARADTLIYQVHTNENMPNWKADVSHIWKRGANVII